MSTEKDVKKGSLKLWIIICALSAAFLLYGLTLFLVVGDKGPPDWDFGVVQDTPGKSEFSTAGGQSGTPEQIGQQHVAGRPGALQAPKQEGTK